MLYKASAVTLWGILEQKCAMVLCLVENAVIAY